MVSVNQLSFHDWCHGGSKCIIELVIECKQKRIPAIPLNVVSVGVNVNGTQVFVTVHSRTSFTAELEGGEAHGLLEASWRPRRRGKSTVQATTQLNCCQASLFDQIMRNAPRRAASSSLPPAGHTGCKAHWIRMRKYGFWEPCTQIPVESIIFVYYWKSSTTRIKTVAIDYACNNIYKKKTVLKTCLQLCGSETRDDEKFLFKNNISFWHIKQRIAY
jgi:hypothetical protein